MNDKEVFLLVLKYKFQDTDFRVDIVSFYVREYEAESDPEQRDAFLLLLWNESLSERWAWDVLIELCRRTKFEFERPYLLNRFAIWVAIGDRRPPDKKRGHPKNDINSDWKIYLTVLMLVRDCDFSKTTAYKIVSDWSKTPGAGCLEPDTVRKRVRKLEAQWPHALSAMARK